jgi:hypothetical protein
MHIGVSDRVVIDIGLKAENPAETTTLVLAIFSIIAHSADYISGEFFRLKDYAALQVQLLKFLLDTFYKSDYCVL